MKGILRWLAILCVLAGVGLGGYWWYSGRSPLTLLSRSGGTAARQSQTAGGAQAGSAAQPVAIRPAADVIGQVSASGHIGLSSEQFVVLKVAGTVLGVNVQLGDQVKAGDELVVLDRSGLERAARQAELAVATQKNALDQLQEPASPDEIAQAEAELASAQANLATVQAGAGAEEIAAAKASVTAAWAKYNDLTADLSPAERTQLEADMRTAEIALKAAQRNYDAVAWRNDVGMTSQAADLQEASIAYEKAQAAFTVAAAPAAQGDVQSAISSARQAEQQLNDLLAKPTAAELATAQATVAGAKAALEKLKRGPSKLESEAAQISLEKALVDLEGAYNDLAQAKVTAPITGTVMEVNAQVGQQLNSGETVVTLADTSRLELPVQVAEVDVDKVHIGQEATIALDALQGRSLNGEVARIAPASADTSGVVNYEVVIALTDDDLTGVRPDMTAVATLANEAAASGWLVPTDSIRHTGQESSVIAMRNNQPVTITVTPGVQQGEWTVVQSPALQAGDHVIGSVATFISNDSTLRGPGGGFGPPGGGGGVRINRGGGNQGGARP
jgi:HlyD family secretion protein